MRVLPSLFAVLVACRPTTPTTNVDPPRESAKLAPPVPIDATARGAAYLVAIEHQLEPGWAQFVEDCRTRLASDHALNVMSRAMTIELVIDRTGKATLGKVTTSGEPDFDRAARGVIGDATFPAPPEALISDDDHAHVVWQFARDRRQAGAATAAIVDVTLPVGEVVDRLLAANEIDRAARRLLAHVDRVDLDAMHRVVIAILRRALGDTTSGAKRAALEAIGRARVQPLAAEVRAHLGATVALDLRVAAIEATAALADRASIDLLLESAAEEQLVVPAVRALVALGARDAAAEAVAKRLTAGKVSPSALAAFAIAPTPALVGKILGWYDRGDAKTRAAACSAVPISKGLRDPDATVRAACIDSALPSAANLARLRELAKDRDRGVRAHAVAALVKLGATPKLAPDDPPEVRVAFASAHPANSDDTLRALAADRDDTIRAAAIEALGERAPELALAAASDASAAVRLAAVAAIAEDAILDKLARDPSPDVALAASIRIAGRRGRAAIAQATLERLLASPPASAGRVHAVLAWLLAS